MIIKTRSYQLDASTYMKKAFFHLFKRHWWITLGLVGSGIALFRVQKYGWALLPAFLLLLYLLFWTVQFYSFTVLEDTQIFFQKIKYQISSRDIMLVFSTKQGMPMSWKEVKRAYLGRDYAILFFSVVHFLYVPNRLFKSEEERKFFVFLLKNKGLA